MRGPGRPFQKGQSGNPGGRPKAAAEIARLILEKTDNGERLVRYALEVVDDVNMRALDPKTWAYCHKWLSDRGLGKPPEDVTVHIGGGGGEDDPAESRRAIIDQLDPIGRAALEVVLTQLDKARMAAALVLPEPPSE